MSSNDPSWVSLIPLLLMAAPFIIFYFYRSRQKAALISLMEDHLETFSRHLRNRRPDSAAELLKDAQLDFAKWSDWKLPIFIRFGASFLELLKGWLAGDFDRDRFKWGVLLGEHIAGLRPSGFSHIGMQLAYQVYWYLYQTGLQALSRFPDLQVETLRLGRNMSALGRQCGNPTIYDEVAMANDIRAHTALSQNRPVAESERVHDSSLGAGGHSVLNP